MDHEQHSTNSNAGPQLFPEIVELILDHFSPDIPEDRTILRHCSQVSTHFAIKAQTMLFREIRLIDDEVLHSLHSDNTAPASISQRCHRLAAILDAKPYLLASIRTLSITLGHANSWISNDVAFIALMERLARPGESGFDSLLLRGTSDTVKIAEVRAFERTILIPFIAPRLVSLHIFLLGSVPIALIAASPRLVDLSLTYAQVERLSAMPPRTTTPPSPTIRNLRVKHSRSMLSVLTSHPLLGRPFVDFSRLVEYTDEMTASWDVHGIQLVLVEAKHSLRKFKITTPSDQGSLQSIMNPGIPDFYLNTFRSITFAQSTALQNIDISLIFGGVQHTSIVASLAVLLSTISTPSTLEEVELTFHLPGGASSRTSIDALARARWGLLRDEVSRIACERAFKLILTFRVGHLPLLMRGSGSGTLGLDTGATRELLVRTVQSICSPVFQSSAEQPWLLFEVTCSV